MFLPHLFRTPEGIPLDSGLWPGLKATTIPLWQDGVNVWFNNKSVQGSKGYTAAFATGVAVPIRGIGQQLVSGGQRMFFGTVGDLYRWNTATVDNMATGFTGVTDATVTSEATLWDFENWGDWMLATNGVDATQVYKGTSFTALANTTFTWAKILVKMGAHVLALNTSNGRSTYEWCSADDVELWTPASANSAGNTVIRDMPSEIIAAKKLGAGTGVYGKNTLHIITYTGAPFYFGHRFALGGVGAVSKHSIVPVGALHYGWGPLGIFRTDGVSKAYIDEPGIREYLESQLNTAQRSKVIGYHNEEASQVIWSYPSGASLEPDKSVGFDHARSVWTLYDFAFTAAGKKEVFSYPIGGMSTGAIHFINHGQDANGAALKRQVVSRPLGWDAQKIKYFDAMSFEAELSGSPVVEVAILERLNDTPSWMDIGDLNASGAPLYIEESGRWFQMRITANAVGENFEIGQINLLGKLLGGEL